MWPLVALVAVGSQIYDGAVFDYNSTAALGSEKILMYYQYADSSSVVELEKSPRSGFYALDLDQFKDKITMEGGKQLLFENFWSPFLRKAPTSAQFNKIIVSGTKYQIISGNYFLGLGIETEEQIRVLPPPGTDGDNTMFEKAETLPVTSNIIYTFFDATPAYASNLLGTACPDRPTTLTACTEVSPDDIYGAGNAFSGVYFYSKTLSVTIPSWLDAFGIISNYIPPPNSVFCYYGYYDGYGIDWTIQNEAKKRAICSDGNGYNSNLNPCDVFGQQGSLAFQAGFRQLDAFIPPPKLPSAFISGSENPTPDTTLECLPWSVIQEQNAEYVLEIIGFEPQNQNEDLKEDLMNITNDASRGCQNFELGDGNAIATSMYCPVMYRPWLYFTLHFVIDPDEILTYTNASNGQTYFFWVARCFNDKASVLSQATDIMFDKYNETCVPCLIGGYSNADTEYLCRSAPEGTYAKADQTGVVPCSASLFQYAHGTGNIECSTCNGTSSVTGASYQVHADANGLGVSCTPEYCLRGQFFNPATELCEICPNSTYTTNNISRACLPCSGVGSHLVVESGYSVGCQCEPGYGKAVDETAQCQRCSSVEYNDVYENSDLPCKPCFDSPSQSVANGNRTTCVCREGWSGPDGTGEDCRQCARGSFSSATGEPNCTLCSEGDYQNEAGRDECLPCKSGTYSNSNGSFLCNRCSEGTYQPDEGDTGCRFCEKGTYQNLEGRTKCSACPAGTFSDDPGESLCGKCSGGTYQDQEASSICALCSPGTYMKQTGRTVCATCQRGSFQEEAGKTGCNECPPGTYSDGTATGADSCINCQVGTYSSKLGETKPCQSCSLGTYSWQEKAVRCTINRVNIRTAVDADPTTGLPDFCERGKVGASGKHAPYGGMPDCFQCHAGTYQPYEVGQAELCLPCPVGTYQDEFGQLDCKQCPSNQRGLEEGMYFCKCGPGTYDAAKLDYPPQCARCTGQDYQDEIGTREGCKSCDELYMPLPGHQGCVPVFEEVTDTCLMIFWERQCYKNGIHPITIGLWLFILFVVYHMGKCAFKEARHHILDTPKHKR